MRLVRFKPKAEYLPGKEPFVDDTPFQHSPSMSCLRHLTEKISEHMWIQLKWCDQYQLRRWTVSSLLSLLLLILSADTVNGWPNYAKAKMYRNNSVIIMQSTVICP